MHSAGSSVRARLRCALVWWAATLCGACGSEQAASDPVKDAAASEPDGGVVLAADGGGVLGVEDAGPSLGGGGDAGVDDPGLVFLRRLNRTHYNNTVRDLLGTELTPADSFPADDLLYGFDNIGAALSTSTLLVEGYDTAAAALIVDLFARPESEAYATHLKCDVSTEGAACAQEILEGFAERAWRRPVAPSEVAPYAELLEQSATPEEGLRLGLQGLLLSANFVFRMERDSDPDDFSPHPISGHELATRLSYLLWGTLPDAELLQAAASDQLGSTEGLQEQMERMLNQAEVGAFVNDMAGLWLQGRTLDGVVRDVAAYPPWSSALKTAMNAETQAFLWELFRSERSLTQLLTADFLMLNEPLAELYGVEGVSGNLLQRVELTDEIQRGGLLTQATFLTVTSHPYRTSPVLRGKWVLDQLLCTPPPPPPPSVDPNLASPDLEGLTLRERLELHQQAGSSCISCHAWMDPIGLGLEQYDVIGAFRTEDEYGPIDPSGELPGTPVQPFDGAAELSELIAADPRFERCVAQQIVTYGLGAKPSGEILDSVLALSSSDGERSLKSIVRALIMSPAFRTRRAGEGIQ